MAVPPLGVETGRDRLTVGGIGKVVACDPTYLVVACDPTYLFG